MIGDMHIIEIGGESTNKECIIREIEEDTKRINQNCHDVSAYNNRGVAYLYLDDYKRAIDDFNNANLNNQNPDIASIVDYHLGVVYSQMWCQDEAINYYNKAIQPNHPNLLSVYIGRGIAFFHKNCLDSAIADLKEALNLDLDNAIAKMYLKDAQQKLDKEVY